MVHSLPLRGVGGDREPVSKPPVVWRNLASIAQKHPAIGRQAFHSHEFPVAEAPSVVGRGVGLEPKFVPGRDMDRLLFAEAQVRLFGSGNLSRLAMARHHQTRACKLDYARVGVFAKARHGTGKDHGALRAVETRIPLLRRCAFAEDKLHGNRPLKTVALGHATYASGGYVSDCEKRHWTAACLPPENRARGCALARASHGNGGKHFLPNLIAISGTWRLLCGSMLRLNLSA